MNRHLEKSANKLADKFPVVPRKEHFEHFMRLSHLGGNSCGSFDKELNSQLACTAIRTSASHHKHKRVDQRWERSQPLTIALWDVYQLFQMSFEGQGAKCFQLCNGFGHLIKSDIPIFWRWPCNKFICACFKRAGHPGQRSKQIARENNFPPTSGEFLFSPFSAIRPQRNKYRDAGGGEACGPGQPRPLVSGREGQPPVPHAERVGRVVVRLGVAHHQFYQHPFVSHRSKLAASSDLRITSATGRPAFEVVT